MDWTERISSNTDICHGKPCIRGTRVMVSVILDNLADNVDEETILKNYPSLSQGDIRAAIGYAAELARERFVPLKRNPSVDFFGLLNQQESESVDC